MEERLLKYFRDHEAEIFGSCILLFYLEQIYFSKIRKRKRGCS